MWKPLFIAQAWVFILQCEDQVTIVGYEGLPNDAPVIGYARSMIGAPHYDAVTGLDPELVRIIIRRGGSGVQITQPVDPEAKVYPVGDYNVWKTADTLVYVYI